MKYAWFWQGILLSCVLTSRALGQDVFPLSYQSCGEEFRIMKSPQRAISMDINTTEIMLALGLAPRMIAIAGVKDPSEVLPELRAEFEKISQIDASYPGLDAIVGKKPDFVFGGWQYGFSEGTGLTPKRLGKIGIGTYALAESCIRIQPRARVSFQDVFDDIRTMGRIFGRQEKANQLIEGYKRKLASFPYGHEGQHKVRAFLYDSGESSPYTAGRYAIPQAMMDAAGLTNIFEDVKTSWTSVSWESVIARKPEFIIIVDYGDNSAAEKIRLLEAKFRKTSLDLMSRKRYVVLPYAAVTPGIRTVDATGDIHRALSRHFPRTGS